MIPIKYDPDYDNTKTERYLVYGHQRGLRGAPVYEVNTLWAYNSKQAVARAKSYYCGDTPSQIVIDRVVRG